MVAATRIKEDNLMKQKLAAQQNATAIAGIEQVTLVQKMQYAQEGLSAASSLMDSLGKLNKSKGKEMQAEQKVIQVGMAIANTALWVTKALAEVPYPYDFVVAGMIAAAGAAQIGVIASSDSGGGSSSVSGGGSMPAQPQAVSQPGNGSVQQAGNLTVVVNGAIGQKKWFEDNLPDILKGFASRNVNTGVAYTSDPPRSPSYPNGN